MKINYRNLNRGLNILYKLAIVLWCATEIYYVVNYY